MNFTPFVPTDKFTMAGLNSKFMEVESDISSALPIGAVIMWSGEETDIPTNWQICDGTNNTPDLRDRFVVGAGNNYTKGATGGSDGVSLNVNEIATHTHSHNLSASANGSHTHTVTVANSGLTQGTSDTGGNYTVVLGSYGSGIANAAGEHTHTVTGTLGNTGSSSPHENRPPYYALYYIMKIA